MQYQHVRRTAPLLAEAFVSARAKYCLRPPRRSTGAASSRHDRSWQSALHGRQRRFPVLLMIGLLGISAAFAVGMGIASRDALRQHVIDGSAAATIPAPRPLVAAAAPAPPSGAEPQGAAMPVAPAASTLATAMPRHPAAKKTASAAPPRVRNQRTTQAARPAVRSAAKAVAKPPSSTRVAAAAAARAPARAEQQSTASMHKPRHDDVAQYAQCTRLDSFLAREKCKWRVCGGKWGSHGCPSYQHKPPPGVGVGLGLGMTELPVSRAG